MINPDLHHAINEYNLAKGLKAELYFATSGAPPTEEQAARIAVATEFFKQAEKNLFNLLDQKAND